LTITSYDLTAQIRLKSVTDTGYRFASGVKATVEADEVIKNIFLTMKRLADKSLKSSVVSLSSIKILKTDFPDDGYKVIVHCVTDSKNEIFNTFFLTDNGDQEFSFHKPFEHLAEVAETLHPDFEDVAHIRITPLNEDGMPVKFEFT